MGYLWFRASAVADKYKSAVYISGLVTFIAAYHYIRIFNSWVDAYDYSGDAYITHHDGPLLTGVPFNDAYRYMDWLLTVPLLLIEILLVMKLDDKDFNSRAWTLGVGSALMIVSGYYGELLVGLAAATKSEENPIIAGKIGTAQVMTCISWCTYPIVYLFPMFQINPAGAVVGIQLGYCVSDIISKCGVGLVIYQISYAKSQKK